MKILVNGGLNLSELDGWWAEAYSPEVGWAIGDGQEHGDDPDWDAHEANELYELLEKDIVPAFYTADERGIPAAWVAKMRASMVQLTPRFSSNRAVREYVEKYYVKAAETYCQRATNESALGLELSNWSTSIAEHWSAVHFGQAAVHQKNDQYFFEVQVSLGGLDPNDVVVELYAEPQADSESFRQKMELKQLLDAPAGYGLYTGRAPAIRPAADYTSRVIPYHPGARVPIEANQILWQH